MKKGEHMSEEQKEKKRGKNNPFYGKHHSKETREYLSLINKGKKLGPMSLETKKKISISNTGKIVSEENRRKCSERLTGRCGPVSQSYGTKRTPESRKLMSEKAKLRCTPEWKKQNSEINKKLWEDEEYRKSRSGENHPGWKGGISFEPYCPLFNNEFKEYIRSKHDRRCFYCGKPENENITKDGLYKRLCVHHVDYNKVDICNGKSWPFVPLCMKCHNKTNYNRWYWFNLLINYWLFKYELVYKMEDV